LGIWKKFNCAAWATFAAAAVAAVVAFGASTGAATFLEAVLGADTFFATGLVTGFAFFATTTFLGAAAFFATGLDFLAATTFFALAGAAFLDLAAGFVLAVFLTALAGVFLFLAMLIFLWIKDAQNYGLPTKTKNIIGLIPKCLFLIDVGIKF
jgi:hypothetical protein